MINLFAAFAVAFSAAPSQAQEACYLAASDPVLVKALRPVAAYHETEEIIAAIHQEIWNHRKDLDPRLVYYRILGESHGNPNAVNRSSGAYGLFQLLGKPYGSSRTYRQILHGLQAAQPDVSPRLIQVRYYLNNYLSAFARAANAGYGCNHKKFRQMSNLERAAYLGWGGCKVSQLKKELSLCHHNASYMQMGACKVAGAALRGNAVPICSAAVQTNNSDNSDNADNANLAEAPLNNAEDEL